MFLPDTLKMVFVGDIMGHMPQVRAARHEGGDTIYNFSPSYQYVQPYLMSADLAFANLEVTFGGEPYRGYPMFSCPHDLAYDLRQAGFDVLFMANNHSADTGKKGIINTLDHVHEAGFYYTGTFRDPVEREITYPLILEKNNIRLALLNYTYGTNGLPVPAPTCVNLIDTVQIRKDIEKAKLFEPDFIIASMHWGEEYQSKENREQQRLARFLADLGTDLIIGSHPHVIRPFKYIHTAEGDSVPVIYSVGNFISNQRDRYKDGGVAFEAIIVKGPDGISLLSVAYEPVWVNCFYEHSKMYYRLIPVNDYKRDASVYSLDSSQIAKMEQFYQDIHRNLSNLQYSGFYN